MKSTLLLCLMGLFLMAARPMAEIELVKKRVLSERVEILIPKGFEVMSEQQMDFAYAKAQSRPSVIFTNNNLVSLAFNYSENEADQDMVEIYAASFAKTYHKQFKDATWFGDGIKHINNRKVGYLEFMKPEMGHEVYTLVFFTDVDGKLMICTFNCADRQKPDWEPVAKQIMLSLKANNG
ncbi:hypothetical protein Q5H93_01210 [Hymenobacter sp. ASUV-10]|uniref:DUF1795 domain-containing protein n=1 Tax=Hymenobacter aranciens TaxID=3063996 RepID=A0ABT9B4Z0_9BACT|nr:hypothetical protein [Hymenobacter sp. ASUV-10]MDO7873330.1 hypothetical protein [Hymenobacter sp. ASUV-10]